MNGDAARQRLKAADWLKRPETQRIYALLDGAKGRTRAVGGIVRDTLLDRPRDLAEIDFATELKPDEVTRRASDAGVPVYPTGIEHGTVTLKLGDLVAEVALRPSIPDGTTQAVRDFLARQIRNRAQKPYDAAFDRLMAQTYGDNGYAWDPIGLKESLERMDRAALVSHYRRHYVPAGMVLAVSGKVKSGEVVARA